MMTHYSFFNLTSQIHFWYFSVATVNNSKPAILLPAVLSGENRFSLLSLHITRIKDNSFIVLIYCNGLGGDIDVGDKLILVTDRGVQG